MRRGLLRPATPADADAWAGEQAARPGASRLSPPVAGQDPVALRRPDWREAYVVRRAMTYPHGLCGAHAVTVVIPKGVPRPWGDPGHSAVYDFNTLSCAGPDGRSPWRFFTQAEDTDV